MKSLDEMSGDEIAALPFSRRVRWDARIKSLGLTERYLDATLDRSQQKHTELVGGPAVITGTPGCGKTTLMAALARRAVADELEVRWPPDRGFARFISVSDLLARFQSCFGKSEEGEEVFKEFASCKWLYLDDLGTEQSTEWSFSCLHRLIDYRWSNRLGIVTTTNLPIEVLNSWSERITSRLLDGAKLLVMESKDWRLER